MFFHVLEHVFLQGLQISIPSIETVAKGLPLVLISDLFGSKVLNEKKTKFLPESRGYPGARGCVFPRNSQTPRPTTISTWIIRSIAPCCGCCSGRACSGSGGGGGGTGGGNPFRQVLQRVRMKLIDFLLELCWQARSPSFLFPTHGTEFVKGCPLL